MESINTTLQEREKRYGSFEGHAMLTQELKVMFAACACSYDKLTPSMMEAIDMIFHKIGRIGNGDPFYTDSWHDIAGYATLVEEELHALEKDHVQNDHES